MKSLFSIIFSCLYFFAVAADGDAIFNVMTKKSLKTSASNTRWAAVYFPKGAKPATGWKTIVWNHGSGEYGSGESGLVNLDNGDGIPEEFSSGRWIDAKFTNPRTGLQEEFLIICPQNQTTGSPWTPTQINYICTQNPWINTIIDRNNIFLAGISLGGVATIYNLADAGNAYLPNYRALFSMSAPRPSGQTWSYTVAKQTKIPIWQFMGLLESSGRIAFAQEIESSLNSVNPGQVQITWYNAGHSGWQPFLSKGYRENGMNMGEWFLYHSYVEGEPDPDPDPDPEPPPPSNNGFKISKKKFQRYKIKT